MKTLRKYKLLLVILAFFYGTGILLWLTSGSIFYLFNFVIIGSCVGLGMGLWPVFPRKKKHISRLISQVTVGGYLFIGLGCGLFYTTFGFIFPENMQLEGFWLWLFSGTFAAGVIHYSVAKIAGPLLFGRAWCGWSCWTASILDLLPWKKSPGRRGKGLEQLRYLHFFLSLTLVLLLCFVAKHGLSDQIGAVVLRGQAPEGVKAYLRYLDIPEARWFIGGNLFYYLSGLLLAFLLKDNRAFCKYMCPIVLFFKIGSRFSIIKVKAVNEGCNHCMACEKNCPMDVRIVAYADKGQRVGSTECILCHTCISSCPKNVLGLSYALDRTRGEYLRRAENKGVIPALKPAIHASGAVPATGPGSGRTLQMQCKGIPEDHRSRRTG